MSEDVVKMVYEIIKSKTNAQEKFLIPQDLNIEDRKGFENKLKRLIRDRKEQDKLNWDFTSIYLAKDGELTVKKRSNNFLTVKIECPCCKARYEGIEIFASFHISGLFKSEYFCEECDSDLAIEYNAKEKEFEIQAERQSYFESNWGEVE